MVKIDDRQPSSIAYRPTALVAGGAGFIGSFLCQSLLLQGCRVIAVDNLVTGKKENLTACLNNPDFRFLNHDLVKPLKGLERLDYVFHVAGLEGDQASALKHLLVNSEGTKNLLELTKKNSAKFLLASSLEILTAVSPVQDSEKVLKKRSAKMSHSDAKKFAEELSLAYLKEGLNVRIVRFGWVYGPRLSLSSLREMPSLIKSALQTEFINVPGSGERSIYPTFVSDVVYGLTKAMFTTQTSGETFTLLSSEKISFFDLSQIIRKLSGKILEVKFVPEKQKEIELEALSESSQKKLGWRSKVNLSEGLQRTFQFFQTQELSDEIRPKKTSGIMRSLGAVSQKLKTKIDKKQVQKKAPLPTWLPRVGLSIMGGLLIILFILLPFSPPFFRLTLGTRQLKKAYGSVKEGKITGAISQSEAALIHFEKASQGWQQLESVFKIIKLDQQHRSLVQVTWLAQKIAKTGLHLGTLSQDLNEISAVVFQEKETDLGGLTERANLNISAAWREIALIEAELKSHPELLQGKFLPQLPAIRELEEDLTKGRKILGDTASFLTILPELLGSRQQKRYLILLQNNMELRPTGGFIGSFILVSFDQGKLTEFETYDVYSADGQLKGHVEPPEPIKEHLGEAGWYLRDSNWDPSFPTSAVRAEWFLEKTLDFQVDGVVAVNLDFATKVLKAIGSVTLTSFQEEINDQNLFEKAEHYSQDEFFPGSTQKKDFLGALARALLERIKNAQPQEQAKIGQAVYQALEEKDVLIFLNSPQAFAVVANLGWEGTVRQGGCLDPVATCLNDYLQIVEANLGVNKANYYLKRNLKLNVEVSEKGEIQNLLKIDYLNTSTSEDKYGGTYKNYLRVYLPLGTKLKQAKINQRVLTTEEIDQGIGAKKTFFGFLVQVPVGEQMSVEVIYQTPLEVKAGQENDYLLFWQKQSGSDPSHLKLNVVLPSQASILATNPSPSKIERGVIFEESLTTDRLFQTRIKL